MTKNGLDNKRRVLATELQYPGTRTKTKRLRGLKVLYEYLDDENDIESLLRSDVLSHNDTYQTPELSNDEHSQGLLENDDTLISAKSRIHLRKFIAFRWVKYAQVLCAIYIIILTFSTTSFGLVDPTCGEIHDVTSLQNSKNGVILINGFYRPIVAMGSYQQLCLAISRISAFSIYPVMILVFLTKCKAIIGFLRTTPISMYMLNDTHQLHSYCGKYIALDVWVHILFHLLRWANQGTISLLWTHRTGLTGFIVVIATICITIPMVYLKLRIPYEIRKGMHYLFYVFAIGMCFHVPPSGIPNGGFIAYVLGFCILLYTLDSMFVFIFMTEKIETTNFHVLPSGVQMTMPVSERFQKSGVNGGFAYVCLPWVNRNQWHAFSLFPDPADPTQRQVFMKISGDWTKEVHEALQRTTVRPVWVQGPFKSPYNQAEMYDNQILVASGIGITPALSVIQTHKDSRRINLIWVVRDSAMLEFFLERLLDHDGWNLIFYTGTTPIDPAIAELNTNVRVVKGRPDLHTIIPNIIYGIESGVGMPETYTPNMMSFVRELLAEKMQEVDCNPELSDNEKLVELITFVHSRGFLFTEIVNDLEQENNEQMLAMQGSLPNYTPNESSSENAKDLVSECRDPLDHSGMLERIRDLGCSQPRGDRSRSRSRFSSLGCDTGYSRCQYDSDLDDKNWHTQRTLQSFDTSASTQLDSMRRVAAVLTSSFQPWEKHQEAHFFVKKLDNKTVLSTWGILYCGGSKPVENVLKRVSEEYQVSLKVESFSW